MVVEIELQSGDKVSMPGNPVKLEGVDSVHYRPPPLLGEHTDRILRDLLGYDSNRIEALRSRKIIQ